MLITITRVEGPTHLCGKPETFETFERANSRLFSMSIYAPKDGGYHKCDFKIEAPEFDLEYSGRYDLKHFTVEAPNLKSHIVGFLRFMGGTGKPHSMSQERYDAFLKRENATPERLQEYLDTADWLEKQP